MMKFFDMIKKKYVFGDELKTIDRAILFQNKGTIHSFNDIHFRFSLTHEATHWFQSCHPQLTREWFDRFSQEKAGRASKYAHRTYDEEKNDSIISAINKMKLCEVRKTTINVPKRVEPVTLYLDFNLSIIDSVRLSKQIKKDISSLPKNLQELVSLLGVLSPYSKSRGSFIKSNGFSYEEKQTAEDIAETATAATVFIKNPFGTKQFAEKYLFNSGFRERVQCLAQYDLFEEKDKELLLNPEKIDFFRSYSSF